MKLVNIFFISSFCLFTCHFPMNAQKSDETIIWKALKDEVKRNMDSLNSKNGPKLCFISVTLGDINSISINSELGSIVQSNENKARSWSYRLLVGSYKLNDENFMGMNNNAAPDLNPEALPIDNDYYGIRRTFWAVLDNSYRSASKNYLEKIESLKKKESEGTFIELPDFSEAPKVVSKEVPFFLIQPRDSLERMACDLSAEFYKYPSLFNSSVQINQLLVTAYFVNSEGTEIKSQIPFFKLSFHAGIFDEFGSTLDDGIQYYAKDIHGLPPIEQIRKDIRSLSQYLQNLKNAPHFDENYSGPVLLVGQPSMRSFMKALFNSENSLIANREDLVSAGQSQLYYSRNRNALDTKIGKMIAPKSFTIKDIPSAHSFQNIPLLGGYKYDAEGVAVPDTLLLVENGVLRNLMGSRTPTKNVPNSNGHRRYNISPEGTSEQVAPGNIFISSTEGQSLETLKLKLIDQAKELGLEYAFIIRPIIESDAIVPEEIIKINVDNGKEEPVRAIFQPDMGNISFRDLANSSKKIKAFNLMYNGNYMDAMNSSRMSSSGTLTGIPMSIISPEAVLINKGELTSDKKQISGNKPEVPNPLEELAK